MYKVFITANDRYLCPHCLARNNHVEVKLYKKDYFDVESSRDVDVYKCNKCNRLLKLV